VGVNIEKLKEIIFPIAKNYGLKAVYLFGSYARGDATDDSDYDFFIKKGELHSLYQLTGLRLDFKEVLHKDVDIVTDGMRNVRLQNAIERDRVLLYEA